MLIRINIFLLSLRLDSTFISGIINTFTVSVSVVICAQVPEPESPDLFSSSASLLSQCLFPFLSSRKDDEETET